MTVKTEKQQCDCSRGAMLGWRTQKNQRLISDKAIVLVYFGLNQVIQSLSTKKLETKSRMTE